LIPFLVIKMAIKPYLNEKMTHIVDKAIEVKDRFADSMISTGQALQNDLYANDPFLRNTRAEGSMKGILVLIIAAVVSIKLAATMLPQASADWTAATQAGGGLANASASDKSTWNVGGSLIPVVGLMIIAGFAIRSMGH